MHGCAPRPHQWLEFGWYERHEPLLRLLPCPLRGQLLVIFLHVLWSSQHSGRRTEGGKAEQVNHDQTISCTFCEHCRIFLLLGGHCGPFSTEKRNSRGYFRLNIFHVRSREHLCEHFRGRVLVCGSSLSPSLWHPNTRTCTQLTNAGPDYQTFQGRLSASGPYNHSPCFLMGIRHGSQWPCLQVLKK